MSRIESSQKLRPPRNSEDKKLKSSVELHIMSGDQSKNSASRGRKLKSLAVLPPNFKKLHIPRPPKDCPNQGLIAQKTQPAACVRTAVGHPVNLNPDFQPLDYPWLQFDDQGMVLPHSILGTLEDFRNFLVAKGETELVKRILKFQRDPPTEASERHHSEAVETGQELQSGSIQSNALQHWQTHMKERRRQQGFLSDVLVRPVESLLMNQANHFRETQEQKDFLNQVKPLIHSGYGSCVGDEFWTYPQRYGDEMSGIETTLTQREKGRWEPVTHVGQPRRIRQESGITCAEARRPFSQTWDQSAYLQQQCQELREVLQDMDINKPDIDGLEVIGTSKLSTFVRENSSPVLEKEEEKEDKETKKEDLDQLAQCDGVHSGALHIPALRFCGQLARWTGNTTTNNKDKVGISASLIFEVPTEEIASSHLELHNEGSTAIFFSWQQLPMLHTFPNLRSQRKRQCFYFNSSSGVILPGETQLVEFIFKSKEPGIKTEVWQLNTHPVLLQGASMQVKLRGVALYQDKTTEQRLFLEKKLEKLVTVKLCQSIVYEMLQGVHTPERPSSTSELYITEEQEFLNKNPKLQYLDEPVDKLKRLWQELNPGCSWDLSVNTLQQLQYLDEPVDKLKRLWQELNPGCSCDLSVNTLQQVVLSLTEPESAQEKYLAQLNCLYLQLSEPSEVKHRLTAASIGQQLWKKLLDSMSHEATRLRNLMDLTERDTWTDVKEDPHISDADIADIKDERNNEAAVKEERSGSTSKYKYVNKAESKSATTEKSVEAKGNKDVKEKGKRKEAAGKRSKEKLEKELATLPDTRPESVSQQPPDDKNVEIYTRLLYKKVYALTEDLVYSLCDLMDELHES